MEEIIVNLHMHTRYSDGGGSHRDIADAALKCGQDAVIVTDHNVLVQGFEGYYKNGKRKVLLLVGQEIHDQDRDPQKNHLLAFGAGQDLATLADDPQTLINAVKDAGGLSFIAHPNDPAAPAFNETDISWVDWSVSNYTGIELWNALSEFKTVIPTKLHGLFHAYFPALIARGPIPNTLHKWDELLANERVVGIGGSDSHATRYHLGPLNKIIFPYDFHFRTVNTHVFIEKPLSGDVDADKRMIYDALAAGHCFVGYDLPAQTRGFRFTAQGRETAAVMGDEIPARGGVTLQAHLPFMAEIRLIKDGQVIQSAKKAPALTHITTQPGVYRVEAYRRFLGRRRGWIFSNPIYVR
ncbi:MAG: CehA/McbA family metallohydrolase [Chloroflexi bacterium]|nr:CehA/McbA family metallohydrolase [Chloroflexota bacterium]